MSSTVEQVKDRLSIEEVVSAYVKLQPAGQNLKARCPFHGERTPSFMVSPARQTYHCFGCSVGGDIFSFIEAIEGVDFKGALKILADKAGVEIKYDKQSKEKSGEKEILFTIMESATEFFANNLKENKEVKEYLKDRGFTEETVSGFRVGFAKDSWEDVLEHLKQKGFKEPQIEKVGLIIKSEKKNGYYDRFRSRIMFPIADSAGRIVAFSGRIFLPAQAGGASAKDEKNAKYVNSPETPLYNKSRILYGYDKARQAIRRNDFAILVEGQMDLLASHQAGYPNTVAISGTALTPEHITLLSRMSKNLVLALDADDAGLASVAKSAKSALVEGFDVKVVRMPEGSDPADIIKEGGGDKEWKKIIRNSKHIVDFLLDIYSEQITDNRKFKLTVEREVLPYINLIRSPIDREHFIGVLAARLGVSEESVKNSVVTSTDISQVKMQKKHPTQSTGGNTVTLKERLVAIALWKNDKDLKDKIENIVGKEELEVAEANLGNRSELFFALEEIYEDKLKLTSDIENFLQYLRINTLQQRLAEATSNMRKVEVTGDEAATAKYLEECNELHKQLANVNTPDSA